MFFALVCKCFLLLIVTNSSSLSHTVSLSSFYTASYRFVSVAALWRQTIVIPHHCAQKHSGKMGNRNKCSNFKALKLWHLVKKWVTCFLYIPEIKASPFVSLALHWLKFSKNQTSTFPTLHCPPRATNTPATAEIPSLQKSLWLCASVLLMWWQFPEVKERGIAEWKWKEK